jgi:hypothetical protein
MCDNYLQCQLRKNIHREEREEREGRQSRKSV